jgi:hypothetical protein
VGPLVGPLVGELVGPLVGELFGPLVSPLVGPLFGELVGPLVEVGPLVGPLFGELVGPLEYSTWFGKLVHPILVHSVHDIAYTGTGRYYMPVLNKARR